MSKEMKWSDIINVAKGSALPNSMAMWVWADLWISYRRADCTFLWLSQGVRPCTHLIRCKSGLDLQKPPVCSETCLRGSVGHCTYGEHCSLLANFW